MTRYDMAWHGVDDDPSNGSSARLFNHRERIDDKVLLVQILRRF